MRYFLVAGEASGDNLGGLLITEIRRIDPSAEFAFWGGDNMTEASGLSPKQHLSALAFMGFVEVVANYRRIRGLLAACKRDVASFAPDALICIDYPGFNLRLSRWAKAREFWVDFYVSPQIWAWRRSRVHKIIRDTSRVLCVLPFEQAFYAGYGYEVAYTGHPLPKRVDEHKQVERLAVLGLDSGLDKSTSSVEEDSTLAGGDRAQRGHTPVNTGLGKSRTLALLPGSRTQEVKALLPVMISAAERFAERRLTEYEEQWRIVIAAAPVLTDTQLKQIGREHGIGYVRNSYDLLSVASLACVASGSATLETALFGVPQVVCYRGAALSVAIARRVVKVEYIALPNLILGETVVPELIQDEVTLDRVSDELRALLLPQRLASVRQAYQRLRILLEPYDAARAAATLIVESARQRSSAV